MAYTTHPAEGVLNRVFNSSKDALHTHNTTALILTDEVTRPANTTQYSQYDIIGMDVLISGVTNTTPAVISTDAASLALFSDGDFVTISGVGGSTGVNGNYTMTKLSSTTFSVPVAAGGAYTSGGTISKMLQVSAAAQNGDGGYINWISLRKSTNTVTNASYDIYMFWNYPTINTDHATQTFYYADKGKGIYLGSISMNSTTGSDSAVATLTNINTLFKTANDSIKIYFRLVNNASTGYIPGSAEKFHITVGVDQF